MTGRQHFNNLLFQLPEKKKGKKENGAAPQLTRHQLDGLQTSQNDFLMTTIFILRGLDYLS